MDLIFLQIERRHVVFVLQQRDGFVRSGQSQFAMLLASHHALRFVGIDIRIVEEPHLKLPEKHGRDQLIELRFLQHALAHQLHQVQIAIGIGQLDVNAGLHRQRAGFLLVFGDEMAVRVGAVTQLPDGKVV